MDNEELQKIIKDAKHKKKTGRTYADKLLNGNEFQDFVTIMLNKQGISVMQLVSKKYQYEVGETVSRHEIKHDLLFRKTCNLLIETHELDKNNEYYPSGILRNDNSIFYVIGDYHTIYLLNRHALQCAYVRGDFDENKTTCHDDSGVSSGKGIKLALDREDFDNYLIAKFEV
jgi:hypothetical protein